MFCYYLVLLLNKYYCRGVSAVTKEKTDVSNENESVWHQVISIDLIRLNLYGLLNLRSLISLRVVDKRDRNWIDEWLTAEHIAKLLDSLRANKDCSMFIDFLIECGYTQSNANITFAISHYLLAIGLPLVTIKELTSLIMQDRTNYQYYKGINREDMSYIGTTFTPLTILVPPENMPSVSGSLYQDRDFVINPQILGAGKHGIVSTGCLYTNTSAPGTKLYTPVAVKRATRFGGDDAKKHISQGRSLPIFNDLTKGDYCYLAELQREVNILGQIEKQCLLSELYITKILSVGHYEVAFRLCWHGDLGVFLRRNYTKISLLNKLLMSRSLLQCMQYISKVGLLHRDIKASNILIEEDGTLRLCDLALAKFNNDKSCIAYGTVQYQSPQIIAHLSEILSAGAQKEDRYTLYDERYSLSLVLFQIFTGLLPFEEYAAQLSSGYIKDFSEHLFEGGRPRIPKSLNASIGAMIQRGWQLNEKDRPDFNQTQSILTDEIVDLSKSKDSTQTPVIIKSLGNTPPQGRLL
jgi:serine/threonine protein kinase